MQVDASRGVAIELGNSAEIFWLPPDTDAVNEAPPGEYRFRSTGEVVVDPDLMTSWTVTAAPGEPAEGAWTRLLDEGFQPPEQSS